MEFDWGAPSQHGGGIAASIMNSGGDAVRKKHVLSGPVNIPEGFPSEADEVTFWQHAELSDAFVRNGRRVPDHRLPPVRATSTVPMNAEQLRRWRTRLGLSQTALGELLDVPQNTISRWELGQLPIEHGKMLRLALERLAALQLDADEEQGVP